MPSSWSPALKWMDQAITQQVAYLLCEPVDIEPTSTAEIRPGVMFDAAIHQIAEQFGWDVATKLARRDPLLHHVHQETRIAPIQRVQI